MKKSENIDLILDNLKKQYLQLIVRLKANVENEETVLINSNKTIDELIDSVDHLIHTIEYEY
ncbi:hypothetical protein EBI_25989 [Enterocytozoon bieneusi H348]|nr:hypothetical protein EBI_26926 [Enterocytozoon bieneusi H348]EED44082.1 hypothetical protein EBI_25989 [Enterocytozoon bieneusi H348]|eukprot:XP_002649987.1 hypothetical protein EBI_25989 [Enterocytozoon bieneusi H348]